MGQYLKGIGGYNVEQIDFYPSGATAVAIASTLVCATWTDYNRKRWAVLVYMSISCIIAGGVLLGLGGTSSDREGGRSSSIRGAVFFGYYLAGASFAGQATTFAWANEICADDDQERAIVLASMNMWNNVVNAWWPLVFYRASDAPRFAKGMIALICVSVATLAITWGVWWMERKENRKRHAVARDSIENSEREASLRETSEDNHGKGEQRARALTSA
ncbi:hypothetical protein AAF712_002109 [Marasmius tenuissimus]|uniref:Uncharacterized protein n=1 Tax=Marasmius tenuissimus TaxID=585030 RepID=A0ABR3AB17_9AGAR